MWHQYEISIGDKIKLYNIEKLVVKKSWKQLTDTAELTLPRNLNLEGKKLNEYIHRGDAVVIKVGFVGGTMRVEFEGYMRELSPDVPFVIRCEDEMMNLKKGNFILQEHNKSLLSIIKKIAPGYSYDIVDATISYSCKDKTAAQVLEDLKDYCIYSRFKKINGKWTLICGFPYSYENKNYTIDLNKQTQESNLNYVSKENYELRIKAIANCQDGKKTIVYYPNENLDGAEVITRNYSEMSSNENERKKLLAAHAKAEYEGRKVDGYRGTLTLWAVPHIENEDTVTIKDTLFPERAGKYLVESTTLESEEPYVTRTLELGKKL